MSPSLWYGKKRVYITLLALSLLPALTAVCLQRLSVPFHVCHTFTRKNESMQPRVHHLVLRHRACTGCLCNILLLACSSACILTCEMALPNTYMSAARDHCHPSLSYHFTSACHPPLSLSSSLFLPFLHAFYPASRPQRPLHLEK